MSTTTLQATSVIPISRSCRLQFSLLAVDGNGGAAAVQQPTERGGVKDLSFPMWCVLWFSRHRVSQSFTREKWRYAGTGDMSFELTEAQAHPAKRRRRGEQEAAAERGLSTARSQCLPSCC